MLKIEKKMIFEELNIKSIIYLSPFDDYVEFMRFFMVLKKNFFKRS